MLDRASSEHGRNGDVTVYRIPARDIQEGDVWLGDGHTMRILKILRREQRFAVPFDGPRAAPPRAIVHIGVQAEFSNGEKHPYRGQYTLQGDMFIEVERA